MAAALESRDLGEGVRQLTIVNPARKNALDPGFFEALAAALSEGAGVRCWLIRGSPQVFSAGFDLQALGQWTAGTELPDERMGEVLQALSAHAVPSVAFVQGPAFGAGCELALSCDFRVADASARFCMPPAKIGVVYAHAGMTRLAEVVGPQRAKWMLLTGAIVEGDEVFSSGLADAQGDEAHALELCRSLARGAPLALEGMKLGLRLRAGENFARFSQLRRQSFESEDAQEGRRAVLEKRAPVFRGR